MQNVCFHLHHLVDGCMLSVMSEIITATSLISQAVHMTAQGITCMSNLTWTYVCVRPGAEVQK